MSNYLVILLVFLLVSCKSTETVRVKNVSNISDAQLRKEVKNNELLFDKLYLKKLQFSFDDGKDKKSFKGSFVVQKDSQIIVSIFILMGREVVRAKLGLEDVIILDKHNKIALHTDYNYFSKKYGIDLDFYSIQAILTNSLFIYPYSDDYYNDLKKYKHHVSSDHYSFKSIKDKRLDRLTKRSRNNILVHEIDIDPELYRILNVFIKDFENNHSISINYNHFKNYDSTIFPEKINMKATKGNAKFEVDLKLNYLEINDGGSLHFKIPSSYKSKTL
ncbi:DUF4292 domain-containing protein [Labilibacter marinus]|uniref:DUF4292 domain-containing protein n=1 Tax=Labilibacter marinus TaxID=1477105 RepID=UPI00083159BE|nr:DUF4292 domain-containing protein [Labilibacter marinus]